jgi:multidrug resistance efflux pump
VFIASGVTQPAPGHRAEIATVVLHPVVRVLVEPGEQVTVGQTLVELDEDEPRAEVEEQRGVVAEIRASLARLHATPREAERDEARAELESAQIDSRAAEDYLDQLAQLHKQEAIPVRKFVEQEILTRRTRVEERAAQARLDFLLRRPFEHEVAELKSRLTAAEAELLAREAELEHYTIHAPIDGVVSWLDVSLGTVTRPGSRVWGEIFDLSTIDVRVPIAIDELTKLEPTTTVEIITRRKNANVLPARLVYISPMLEPDTDKCAIVVRCDNSEFCLRNRETVQVRFRLP